MRMRYQFIRGMSIVSPSAAFKTTSAVLWLMMFLSLNLVCDFSQKLVCAVVDEEWNDDPDAVEEDKDKPEILQFEVSVEPRGPVLQVMGNYNRGWLRWDGAHQGRLVDEAIAPLTAPVEEGAELLERAAEQGPEMFRPVTAHSTAIPVKRL